MSSRSILSTVVSCLLAVSSAASVNAQVVISQVFGGGGNSGAPFTHDFVELFNRSHEAVDLSGWTLQFGTATGTTSLGSTASTLTELSGLLLPGQYLLVRGASGGANGIALPFPDILDATPPSIAAASAKIALARTTASLGTHCPVGGTFETLVADFVGFGTANCWEGFGAAPAGSNIRALVRIDGGCTDMNDNAGDFIAADPAPRSRASALHVCPGAGPPPAVIPEPRSVLLLATGGALLALFGVPRRRALGIRR